MELRTLDRQYLEKAAAGGAVNYDQQPYIEVIRFAQQNGGGAEIGISADEGGKDGKRMKVRLTKAANVVGAPKIRWLECDETTIRFAFKQPKVKKVKSQTNGSEPDEDEDDEDTDESEDDDTSDDE